jgi:hypothetical protein
MNIVFINEKLGKVLEERLSNRRIKCFQDTIAVYQQRKYLALIKI